MSLLMTANNPFKTVRSVRSVFGLLLSQSKQEFSTTCPQQANKGKRKPNYSTLTKHLKPDGMTGPQRRNVLREKAKYSRGSKGGKYIPVTKRLEPIRSDIRPSTKPAVESVSELSQRLASTSFDDLGIHPQVLNSALSGPLKDTEDPQPTEIQALAIPKILQASSFRQFLCAAETGSGKTLAYLLPTMHELKIQEEKNPLIRRLDHPRAIVLVPTRELVTQVLKTCKSLSHVAKLRAEQLTSRVSRTKLVNSLASSPIDILVTTPTSLLSHVQDGTLSMADVTHLIIDEADTLFDSGWGDECKQVLDTLKKIAEHRNLDQKVIIVSATLPRSVSTLLDHIFPKLVKITTPSLHKSLPNLKQSFVDLTRYNGNRQLGLLEVLKKNIKDDKTLIFCNTKKSVELTHRFLQSKGIETLALYKDAPMSREEALRHFSQPATGIEDEDMDARNNMLISTDIASRGVDTTFVNHVILYDFPSSVIDYLHRVGRTARAGRNGKATGLIGRKDKMLADRIQRAIREGTVLT
ncbi:P-loop containing nucleoside triphosphate hydrolase protein [Umbelopsis sp. PMI_123]|nr:P-loop containing nucleoside triphosphate hydrolase protein [Umbelopsis sp. PMI_123]